MRKTHRITLNAINRRPTSGTMKWSAIEALFVAIGAVVEERAGSRVAITLGDAVHVFHRPHGGNQETDKGAINTVRRVLREAGIK
jgi:HicA toxin of bacterial toxin-antitoxin,